MTWAMLLAHLREGGYSGAETVDAVIAYLKAEFGKIEIEVPVVVESVPADVPQVETPTGEVIPVMTTDETVVIQLALDVPVKKAEPLIRQLYKQAHSKTSLAGAQQIKALLDRIEVLENDRKLLGEGKKATLKAAGTAVRYNVSTHECIEDDPCLGYTKWEAGGFGFWLADVAKAARAISTGQPTAVPQRLTKAHQIMVTKATGLGEATDDEGGFLVAPEHSNELLRKVHMTGVVFSRARSVPMGTKVLSFPTINETSRADGSRHGGIRGYWVEEAGALTASKPAFGKVTLTAHKLTALGYISSELVEDSPISLSLFGEMFAEELAFKADDATINGTGGGQPLGILSANCLVSVAKENGQAANTFVFENVVNMWARMWAPSRASAVWFINQDVEPQLHAMVLVVGTGGVPVYLPAGGVSGSPFASLYGRPVVPIEHCATLGTVGDVILADNSQYLWGTRGGMKTASSIHVQFTTDEEAFRTTWRVDGQPWWNSALTPFKGTSNTLSPFVALATRA